MRRRRLLTSILVALCVFGCRLLPEPPTLYDEEVVLRVWDSLDVHYGSETFFECEYLPVLDGKIEIIKPYGISDIAVVSYSPSANKTTFFRVVTSSPGENEVVVEGTTLRFHSCHEGQSLFVAWKREPPEGLAAIRTKKDESEK